MNFVQPNFCRIDYPFIEHLLKDWFHYNLNYSGPEITIKINGISCLLNGNLQISYNGTRPHKHIIYEIRIIFGHELQSLRVMIVKTRKQAEIEMIKIMFDINTQLSKYYGVEWNLGPEYYPKRLENLVSEHIFGLDGPIYNQGVL